MDDHTFTAVLRDPESLRKVGREDFDGVDPGPAPELPRAVRPPQPDGRRSVPAEIVEHDRSIRRRAVRAKDEPKRLDGLPARVWQTPSQDRLRARRKRNRLSIDRQEAVVRAINQRAQADA